MGPSDQNIFAEPSSLYENETSDNSETYNLLSLDGGGIRGYWTLLVLEDLIKYIADVEENPPPEWQIRGWGPSYHSFTPCEYPDNISQLALDPKEQERTAQSSGSQEDHFRALNSSRRFLLCHYFNYICGSSTGALIAIMLGRFRMPIGDCLAEYRNLGDEVFGKPRFFNTIKWNFLNRNKYRASSLQKLFLDVTKRRGEHLPTKETPVRFPLKRGICQVFVTSLRSRPGGHEPQTTYLFRTYNHVKRYNSTNGGPSLIRKTTDRTDTSITATVLQRQESNQLSKTINYGVAEDFEIWEVARAATAAPLYFKPMESPGSGMVFQDGGFSSANNPTLVGYREIQELHGKESIGVIVSVGTSRRNAPNGSGSGLKQTVKAGINLATDPEAAHAEMERKKAQKPGLDYFRFNDPHKLDIELDEWKPLSHRWSKSVSPGSETINKITSSFQEWASRRTTRNMMKQCAEALVQARRNRAFQSDPAAQARWERYALATEFGCNMRHCSGGDFLYRDQFQSHLERPSHPSPAEVNEFIEQAKTAWTYPEASSRSR